MGPQGRQQRGAGLQSLSGAAGPHTPMGQDQQCGCSGTDGHTLHVLCMVTFHLHVSLARTNAGLMPIHCFMLVFHLCATSNTAQRGENTVVEKGFACGESGVL